MSTEAILSLHADSLGMQNHSPAEPSSLATLLIVRSNVGASESFAKALAGEQYDILCSASTAEALRILATRKVDVVLADYDLTRVTDGEFFAIVRSRHPATIRVLIVIGSTSASAEQAVQSGGAHYCLCEPCDDGEVALALFNFLVQRSFLPPECEGVLPSPPPTAREIPLRKLPIG
jgi:CheY-like chemotaxis protein